MSATLIALAAGKEVKSEFAFNGKSAGGRQVNVRLLRPGKGSSDLTEGKVGLELPLELSLDGKKSELLLKLTTESADSADGGTINGRRARIDHQARTATLAMVGNARFKDLLHVSEAVEQPRDDAISNIKGGKVGKVKAPSELLLVVQSEGKLAAVEQ